MSSEAERLIELAGELGQKVNGALRDVIPPEAQSHLLKAQKELLTALFLIYEHQVGARRPEPQPPATRTSGGGRAAPVDRQPPRLERIEIE